MSDETGVLAPVVKLVARRLEREADPHIGAQIEDDLMRGARSCPGDRAGKAAFDRAMEMPAKYSFDLRVSAYDLRKSGATGSLQNSGAPRQLALMHALVRFAQIAAAGSFSTGEIHPHVVTALGSAAERYSVSSLVSSLISSMAFNRFWKSAIFLGAT
jgi:hypothetical protein